MEGGEERLLELQCDGWAQGEMGVRGREASKGKLIQAQTSDLARTEVHMGIC